MASPFTEQLSVQQRQAAYAIALANEIIELWEGYASDEDLLSLDLFKLDMKETHGLPRTTYTLTELGDYTPEGGSR